MVSVARLAFLEQAAFVVVEGCVFSEDRIVLKVSELGAAANGDASLVGAPTGKPEKLHFALLVFWDLLWILRGE
jgi:hypothetical protein